MSNQKRIPYIDYECLVGERVQWLNMANKKFEGIILKWVDTTATVELDDKTTIDVKC